MLLLMKIPLPLFWSLFKGEGGIIVPPAGYLREVKEICEKKGALLIADEVQTGIGRTGEWFGVNHDGVTPDLDGMR